jgi:hypothetical protein
MQGCESVKVMVEVEQDDAKSSCRGQGCCEVRLERYEVKVKVTYHMRFG